MPLARTPSTTSAVLLAAGSLAAALAVPGGAAAAPRTVPDGSVVAQWNAVAEAVIGPTTPIPSSTLPYAAVSLAVHDAVVAVEGDYASYLPARGPRGRGIASSEVAAATAAHDVLVHYYPAASAALDAAYAETVNGRASGPALRLGTRIGEQAAVRVVQSRAGAGDGGVGVVVPPLPDVAPGVWRSSVPMAVPWLGYVRPFVLESPTTLAPPGPDAITSEAYAVDFAEVKAHGTAADRTDGYEERARLSLFHNHNSVQQHQLAMRKQVAERDLDIVDAAHAFALLNASLADSIITCWRAKSEHAFWRPVTAIHEAGTDGNTATEEDPSWTPRAASPPYPDYPSGHACITGAATGTYATLFGADHIDVELFSTAPGNTDPLRRYDTAASLDAETMNARIWLGLHFRRAMTDANALGHATATAVAERLAATGS